MCLRRESGAPESSAPGWFGTFGWRTRIARRSENTGPRRHTEHKHIGDRLAGNCSPAEDCHHSRPECDSLRPWRTIRTYPSHTFSTTRDASDPDCNRRPVCYLRGYKPRPAELKSALRETLSCLCQSRCTPCRKWRDLLPEGSTDCWVNCCQKDCPVSDFPGR